MMEIVIHFRGDSDINIDKFIGLQQNMHENFVTENNNYKVVIENTYVFVL